MKKINDYIEKNCGDCLYAVWDYEEYYGGSRRWFVVGCRKGLDEPDRNGCEDWEEANAE